MSKTYFYLKTFELDVENGREHNVVNIGLFTSRDAAVSHLKTLNKTIESEGYEFAIIELELIQ